MSLITRCPACDTVFKVVADQLRVSQGWVRCGHCSDVFDAVSQLQPVSLLPLPEVSPEPMPVGVSVVDAWPVPVVAPAEVTPARDLTVAVDLVALPAQEEAVSVATMLNTPTDVPAAACLDVDATPSPHAGTEDALVADFDDVSFLQQARRQTFWKKTSVRAVSGVLGLMLLLLLGLQWVLQHKDSLALTDPRWPPLLQAVCQPLNCAIQPLRRIESLVIDSSSFSKSGPEAFRLSFVLKNKANLPLETPLLELTLTDIHDKAILRRVLTPEQFGYSAGASLPARAEVAGVVSLSAASEGNRPQAVSAAAVAGYRVLVFYP